VDVTPFGIASKLGYDGKRYSGTLTGILKKKKNSHAFVVKVAFPRVPGMTKITLPSSIVSLNMSGR